MLGYAQPILIRVFWPLAYVFPFRLNRGQLLIHCVVVRRAFDGVG
jgi:hypothetical protein